MSRSCGLKALTGLALACCGLRVADAQQEAIHWAYAAFFGTGQYTLDGRTDTTILAVTPGRVWREAGFDESGERVVGYRLRLPISVGAYEFSSLDQIGDISLDSINAFSFVPGIEIEVPMSERWSLKSLAYLGVGVANGGERARIFRLGFRSRLAFASGDTEFFLVNGLGRIGFSTDRTASDQINLVLTGLDFRRPLKNTRIGGVPLFVNWDIAYTNYLDSLGLDLPTAQLRSASVGAEWELGFGFSKQTGQFSFWRLKFDRLGLAYRFDSHGAFTGVGIAFNALFDR